MNPEAYATPFRELMATLGYLLLEWGALEKHLDGQPPPPALDDIRSLRNNLCHGLEGASADPSSGQEPFVRCRTLDGKTRQYALSELDNAIAELERFRLQNPR